MSFWHNMHTDASFVRLIALFSADFLYKKVTAEIRHLQPVYTANARNSGTKCEYFRQRQATLGTHHLKQTQTGKAV